MNVRAESHQIDDQARTAVEKVLAAGGLATEVVGKDYGEDLLVQISIDDQLQPARCWVQVKGTKDAKPMSRRDGTYAVRVGTSHLLRWARSADPVLLVLWDVTQDRGWWVTPKSQVDQYSLYVKGKATQTLRVPKRQMLNRKAVSPLAWQITLEHFSKLIVQANASRQVAVEMSAMTDPSGSKPDVTDEPGGATVLAFDVLRLLGVISEGGVSEEALRMIRTGMKNMSKNPQFMAENPDLLGSAAILVLVGMAHQRGGNGLPVVLLYELANAFVAILQGLELP